MNKLFVSNVSSRIILALDIINPPLWEKFNLISKQIAAIKIGLPLLLRKPNIVSELSKYQVPIIADLKLADIPNTMRLIVEAIKPIDAVIAHSFIGSKAISELKEFLDAHEIELILVVAMSHKGAEEFINRHFSEFLAIAKEYANGIVAPATYPEYISKAREYFGKTKVIMAPGIGAQGATIGSALRAGADFEIIGRYITLSENPLETVKRINELHNKVLNQLP